VVTLSLIARLPRDNRLDAKAAVCPAAATWPGPAGTIAQVAQLSTIVRTGEERIA